MNEYSLLINVRTGIDASFFCVRTAGRSAECGPHMATLTSGTKLGIYEIVGPIGAGCMGTVYRARDTRLPREAAINALFAKGGCR